MMILKRRNFWVVFCILLLVVAVSLPCLAAESTVKAVILADGTIVNIGHSDWSSSLQPGQTQVDLGQIEIPDDVLTDYVVENGALVPKGPGN